MFRRFGPLLAVVPLVALPVRAQCLGDDGMSGPCTGFARETVPAFPAATLPAISIVRKDCVAVEQHAATVRLSAPAWQACGRYLASASVDTEVGTNVLAGVATLDYSRTWEETGPSGRIQVYRFLVKVDLAWLAQGSPLLPPCLGQSAWRRAFYHGYADWAFGCESGGVENALVLFHACDGFVHADGISSRPGVFHPDRSFALVAPSTAARPFVPSAARAPFGAAVGGAVREGPDGGGGACANEDPLAGGAATFLAEGCGCPLAAGPPGLAALRLVGQGSCVTPAGSTSFASVRTTPAFPWLHLAATSLGRWSAGGYPGPEEVWLAEVPLRYHDARSTGPNDLGEVYYGAVTRDGYPQAAGDVARLDLAANASFRLGLMPSTLVGDVRTTRNVIQLDLP